MAHQPIRNSMRWRFAWDRLRRYGAMSLDVVRTSGWRAFLAQARSKIISLRQQASGPGPTVLRFQETVTPAQRVLFIEARMPTPDRDSGSHRLLRLMALFRELGYEVVFVPTDLQFNPRAELLLANHGILVPTKEPIPSLEAFLSWFGARFGIVVVSRADVADWVLPCVRRYVPDALLVFDTVDLHFLREQREAQLHHDSARRTEAAKRRRQELNLMRQADVTWVVSDEEARMVREQWPEVVVQVVSNIHNVQRLTRGFETRKGILFVGGFDHGPNVDAVIYYLQAIDPIVARQLPDAQIHIVGSHPPAEILRFASQRIKIHGHVADLSPYLNGCKMSIAPLRYGAGVKGKINLSMSCGLPVVATPVAAEGTHLVHDRDGLIATGPEPFAAQMVRLYRDPKLWQKISDNAKLNVQRHFSKEVARKSLEATILRGGKTLPAAAGSQVRPP